MSEDSLLEGLSAPPPALFPSDLQPAEAVGNGQPDLAEDEAAGRGLTEDPDVAGGDPGDRSGQEDDEVPEVAEIDGTDGKDGQPPGGPPKVPETKKEKKLPRIQWSGQSLSMVEPEVIAAISSGNSPPTIFQFGGKLVRLHQGKYGVYLEPVAPDAMRHHLDRWATFTINGAWEKGRRPRARSPLRWTSFAMCWRGPLGRKTFSPRSSVSALSRSSRATGRW